MIRIGRQKDINNDLGDYLNRKSGSGGKTTAFFKQVESLIPKWSDDSQVPEIDTTGPTIIKRSEQSFFTRIFSGKKSQKELAREAQILEEDVEPVAEEIEEIDEEIEELEQKRQGLMARFFGFFFGSGPSGRDDEKATDDIDTTLVQRTTRDELQEQTREVLKITHKWISRLPPEHIHAFRNSEDFKKYKDCLQKYQLIK